MDAESAFRLVRPTLDRCQALAWSGHKTVPSLPGFAIKSDTFVRPQTDVRTYSRVRILENHRTKTEAFVQYFASKICVSPIKVTLVPPDETGLSAEEFHTVASSFHKIRLSCVELALNFSPASRVDRSFVIEHALCGKARLVGGRFYSDLRYGTRHSDTMVRAYKKYRTYRVEIELHSPWLRSHVIQYPNDLSRLARLVAPSHLLFVTPDWAKLQRYAERHSFDDSLLTASHWSGLPLQRLTDYLRSLGVINLRRFLKPLPINRTIRTSLFFWASDWCTRGANGMGK